MNFTSVKYEEIDFSKLKEGTVANATLSSFNYIGDWCFGTFVADGKSVRAIIGHKEQYPIKDMLPLKGIEVQVEFAGTKVSNGVTYPRYYISF